MKKVAIVKLGTSDRIKTRVFVYGISIVCLLLSCLMVYDLHARKASADAEWTKVYP
jgi:hypothetical protein